MRFSVSSVTLRATALAAFLAAAAAAPAGAITINVPGDQPTIQAGVNVANAGDVVLVAPGTYNEAVTMTGKSGIVLRGSGCTVTTILAPGTGPALRLTNCTGIDVSGFRMSSQVGAGDNFDIGAIRILDCSRIRIFKNTLTSHASNGIVLYGSTIEVFNNLIVQLGDDGIRLEGFNSNNANFALVYNNTIADNRGGSGVGLWLRRDNDAATAFNNIFFNNDFNIGVQTPTVINHDYNVISTPATNFFGSVSRNANEPDCNPMFVNAPLLDYHLTAGSCAQDAGIGSFLGNLAASDDKDGDARPSGAGFDIGADEIVKVAIVCEPRTQGFWHRQCLGIGEIRPGRNGNGPGPHPQFMREDLDLLLALVSEQLAFSGQSACEALDANPPSDPCERALKQFAALLLNLAAQFLSRECKVDFSAVPDVAGKIDLPNSVGELVPIIRGLIAAGGRDNCKLAAAIAGAVNEGTALAGPGMQAAELVVPAGARVVGAGIRTLPADGPGSAQSPPAMEGASRIAEPERFGASSGLAFSVQPNPGRTQRISFTLPGRSDVDLAVFDLAGRRVATLAQGVLEAGDHARVWEGSTLDRRTAGAGIYFYRLRVGAEVHTLRAVRID